MFGASTKDEIFYGAFREQAQLAVDASTKFGALLDNIAAPDGAVESIRQDGKRADAILRRTVRELHATWITPLDRHQIHELVVALSGVLTLIGSTAIRLVLFGVTDVREEARDLARDLGDACKRIRAATDLVPKLSKGNADELIRLVGEVHEIEGKADEAYRRGLARLFAADADPLTVLKWREVFDNLERAVDLCRDVAAMFEGIVLENA
jgi:uncharacterized protein Yka (UPF0111/DUF47 family)